VELRKPRDMVTKELLIKMKEAGCVSFWCGLEIGHATGFGRHEERHHARINNEGAGLGPRVGMLPVPNVS